MELLQSGFDLFMNLDQHLTTASADYGAWIYAVLFAVIFAETGLVFTPFLPGDSLLFAAGALASRPGSGLSVWMLLLVLIAAAILGDAVNYSIGRRWGRTILDSPKAARFVKPEYIAETEGFFARHGGKTITIARFFPFVRTFAPFVSGVCRMDRLRFSAFNVAGGILWVTTFVLAGFFFGKIPFVEKNFEILVLGIIAFSAVPAIYHAIANRVKSSSEAPQV